jgi:hypothetical protein
MSQYSITVEIESSTLTTLLAGEYHLVLVRDMGEDGQTKAGNIVFATFPPKGPNKLSHTQTFSWKEEYAVYATSKGFQNGNPVSNGSSPVELQRGQTVVIEASKNDVTGSNDPTQPLTVVNEWNENAYIVVACKGKTNDGKEVMIPHYVSKVRVKGTESLLTPVQTFSCFFVTSTTTKTMIDYSRTRFGNFTFGSGGNNCTVKYDARDAVTPAERWTPTTNATKLN